MGKSLRGCASERPLEFFFSFIGPQRIPCQVQLDHGDPGGQVREAAFVQAFDSRHAFAFSFLMLRLRLDAISVPLLRAHNSSVEVHENVFKRARIRYLMGAVSGAFQVRIVIRDSGRIMRNGLACQEGKWFFFCGLRNVPGTFSVRSAYDLCNRLMVLALCPKFSCGKRNCEAGNGRPIPCRFQH